MMDYEKIIPLVASICTITTTFLTLDEKLKNFNLVLWIRVILIYALPILFIQQIIEFTYLYKNIVLVIFPFYLYLKLREIYTIYYGEINCNGESEMCQLIKNNQKSFIMLIFILVSIFTNICGNPSKDLFIENFTNDQKEYVIDLMQYHINLDMINYLYGNLFMTVCSIVNASNVIVIYYLIKSMIEYTCGNVNYQEQLELHNGHNGEKRAKLLTHVCQVSRRFFVLFIIYIAISTGGIFCLLEHIFKLF